MVLRATGTTLDTIAPPSGAQYSHASAAYRGRLTVHEVLEIVDTTALPSDNDTLGVAYGVDATDVLVTRVVKVEGDTVTKLTETTNDEAELVSGGANVDASGAFSSNRSVWAPSARPHL
jgi:hypothetical protein